MYNILFYTNNKYHHVRINKDFSTKKLYKNKDKIINPAVLPFVFDPAAAMECIHKTFFELITNDTAKSHILTNTCILKNKWGCSAFESQLLHILCNVLSTELS